MSIYIMGVDLAKEVFQVYAGDRLGKKIWSKKMSREKFKLLWKDVVPCLVVMESCGSSHYWARKLIQMGFDVKLVPPRYVKPFVKTNKSDEADAEAIVVAALSPGMRFTGVKTQEQQSIQALHRVRDRLMKQRTQIINEVRGFLREFGFIIPVGVTKFKSHIIPLLEEAQNDLPPLTREMIFRMLSELKLKEEEILKYENILKQIFDQNDVCKRLLEIHGVGFLSASALFASLPNINQFKNGRALAAFLGLVPRHTGSGGKIKILGMSKRGDTYLRTLLIQGARSVVSLCLKRSDAYSMKVRKLKERIGFNKTCIAIANRNARVAWVIMAKGERYRAHAA